MHQSLEKTLQICDDIENLLANAIPQADDTRLRRITTLANSLGGSGPYTARNVARLINRAGIYFSTRRHQQETGGAPAVMQEMRYSLLGRIRDEARERAKSQ